MWNFFGKWIGRDTQRWILGLTYIVAIAAIWIAASYIVQSVVDDGVSPFLVTYICNSLFMVYIPLVEIGRYLDGYSKYFWAWGKSENDAYLQEDNHMENVHLLPEMDRCSNSNTLLITDEGIPLSIDSTVEDIERRIKENENTASTQITSSVICEGSSESATCQGFSGQVVSEGPWTRTRVAKVSLLICPFWFLAQLAFNVSLKYTSVTSNTILSSTSSIFTFLVSLAFLGEQFTWVKLISVLLCMGGTVVVSLADSESRGDQVAKNPAVGDILSLISSATYAIYVTLIRKKLPDEDKGEGQASTAQFLGFLGLFNFLIFLPVAMILYFTSIETFDKLKWKQFGLIVGKGLLDNVLSDYLWVKATQLTTTTVATAGLSIQVPIAAIVDTITGKSPGLLEYLGAVFVMLGFTGINIPSDIFLRKNTPSDLSIQSQPVKDELDGENVVVVELGKISS